MERQAFFLKGVVVTGTALLLNVSVMGQELIPNGIFNYGDTCSPGSLSNGYELEPWFSVFGSPNYFHPCKRLNNDYSVPQNFGGGGQPFEGEGYGGVGVYVTLEEYREFLGVELTEPLVEGIGYHAVMYVSMMDSAWYATKNIGMLFTNSIPPWDLGNLFEQIPQVRYQGVDFLTNKDGWTKIEGSFVAYGGERYLTIGNFDDDAHTDTLFVPGGGVPPSFSEEYWAFSYYYVDGVSVIPDSIYLGIQEQASATSFYPNPATESVSVEAAKWQNKKLELIDATGRQVLQQSLGSSREIISVGNLPRGVYIVVLREDGTIVERRKLTLQGKL